MDPTYRKLNLQILYPIHLIGPFWKFNLPKFPATWYILLGIPTTFVKMLTSACITCGVVGTICTCKESPAVQAALLQWCNLKVVSWWAGGALCFSCETSYSWVVCGRIIHIVVTEIYERGICQVFYNCECVFLSREYGDWIELLHY